MISSVVDASDHLKLGIDGLLELHSHESFTLSHTCSLMCFVFVWYVVICFLVMCHFMHANTVSWTTFHFIAVQECKTRLSEKHMGCDKLEICQWSVWERDCIMFAFILCPPMKFPVVFNLEDFCIKYGSCCDMTGITLHCFQLNLQYLSMPQVFLFTSRSTHVSI